MRRAIQLAQLSTHDIKTNPKVGCVIVHKNIIIGEGYHKTYVSNHAEINAINSIKSLTPQLAKESTVYVTLEPCAHQGKTPSCARALVRHGFKKVMIGSLDPFKKVNGKGIEILKNGGIEVEVLNLNETNELIRQFVISSSHNRSYVCLKWAQTFSGYMGKQKEEIGISHPNTKTLVHKWRSEFQGILIGPDTLNTDDPKLSNRLYPGDSPIPIIIDRFHRTDEKAQLFKHDRLIYITTSKRNFNTDITQIIIPDNSDHFLHLALKQLYDKGLKSILVEGGRGIHNSFIEHNLWDEARVINSSYQQANLNIKAPFLVGKMNKVFNYNSDYIQIIHNK